MNLRLRRHHIELFEEETRRVNPFEACGILFGKTSLGTATVEKIVIAPNTLRSTVRFEINPELVVKAIMEAEREGLDFIGLFHSHPAPAKPSLIDKKFMKLWGDTIWLILSSTERKFAAFQMQDGEVKEVTIEFE